MAKRGKCDKPKRRPVLGYPVGDWESYGRTIDSNKFFSNYSGFKSLAAFYKRVSEDDKMMVMQKDYRYRPYWFSREPDEYASCTRAVDKEKTCEN